MWLLEALCSLWLLFHSVNCMQTGGLEQPSPNQTIYDVLNNLSSSPYLVSDPRSIIEPLHSKMFSIPELPSCFVKIAVSVETRGPTAHPQYKGSDMGFYTRCPVRYSKVKETMQTCLYSGAELKRYIQHRPKHERRFEIRYLQGIPSGCPSGSQLLKLHEKMGVLLGAAVSELEDISAIHLFRVNRTAGSGHKSHMEPSSSKKTILTGHGDVPVVESKVVYPPMSVAVRSVILYTLLNATEPIDPYSYYSFHGYEFVFENQQCLSKFHWAFKYIYQVTTRQVIAQLNIKPCHDCLVQTDKKRSREMALEEDDSQKALQIRQLLQVYGGKRTTVSSIIRDLHRLGQSGIDSASLKAREECEFLVQNLFVDDFMKESQVVINYETNDVRYSNSLKRAVKILSQAVDMMKTLY